MIICNLNVIRVTITPYKTDTPLLVDTNTVLTITRSVIKVKRVTASVCSVPKVVLKCVAAWDTLVRYRREFTNELK